MRNLVLTAALALLAACVSAPSSQSNVSADPVIAAERAFAARAGEIGWIPAFCEYSAPDSDFVGPSGLGNAHTNMCAQADDGERNLYWAPNFAGIARSGDLGFTTGAASFDAARTPAIQYFTVWRRQPDGTWKWVWDGGPGPVTDLPSLAPEAEVSRLPIAANGVGSAATAAAQVQALENGAATAGALTRYLSGDAHVYRGGRARGLGGAVAAENLAYPNAQVGYRLLRTEASAAGDMVFTLGEASWQRDGQQRSGYFMRIWQHQPGGWRIVYDQLIGGRPPPAN